MSAGQWCARGLFLEPTPPDPDEVADGGGREREILALLEQSMSNKRIALVLNLSVDTVKWNLRQIYAKLNVSRRYDAILVAAQRVAAAGLTALATRLRACLIPRWRRWP
ncbi:helix-turn-helix domain-containing protein [Cupriavidus necator]|uniref:helix-turn-helix domain-containing protein n=2 Tax=Cupriavidus necator TaxID=106590 RepID=UPI0027D8E617|nr:helix-turn-helix transcriptional regulator [Cupriavidus necator]